MRVVSHQDINRPAPEVSTYVSNQFNTPEWQQGLDGVRRTTDGPVGIGTRHTFVRRLGRRRVRRGATSTSSTNRVDGWCSPSRPMVSPAGAGMR